MTESQLCNGAFSESDTTASVQDFQSTSASWEGFFKTVANMREHDSRYVYGENDRLFHDKITCLEDGVNNNGMITRFKSSKSDIF